MVIDGSHPRALFIFCFHRQGWTTLRPLDRNVSFMIHMRPKEMDKSEAPDRDTSCSLIAALTSRPLFTLSARVMVLFAVSASCRNIWSGPEDRHCKVHNGLTLITRPSPRRAIACTLALGRCVLAYLTS